MRRAPVLVAAGLFLAGLAVMAPGWLLGDRDYLAVTPQPPAVESPTEIELTPESTLCMDRVALDEHSEEARILSSQTVGSVPLEITIEGEGGYRARGRADAELRKGGVAAIPVEPAPARSVVATVCLHNRTTDRVFLAAVVDRRRSRSNVTLNDVAAPQGFVIQFAEREPASILERLPDSVQRMSVFRPVPDAALWLLMVLFAAGVPILALWAFARALRHDGA